MAAIIYSLCALTCLVAAGLLLRAWSQSRLALLFWSGLCFIFLAFSNTLLVIDRIVLPDMDLSIARFAAAFLGLLLLLYGLIMESD
jgi:hydrogenase/urease accessory protein HupE